MNILNDVGSSSEATAKGKNETEPIRRRDQSEKFAVDGCSFLGGKLSFLQRFPSSKPSLLSKPLALQATEVGHKQVVAELLFVQEHGNCSL